MSSVESPIADTVPPTLIPTLQKVCDIYDWFDPAIDHIVRNRLRAVPGGRRRSWEFAMIYLALHQGGALRPDARGLGMGAGTERLIYALADVVGSLTVTDLYQRDSRWVGVRTDDPQALIEARAPWPLLPGRVRAERADMRALSYEDNSFDFAWSTGAFEHIGGDEDFLANLNETARVLKPGGIYAFTTVVTYAEDSHRIPHNYYFHPAYLADLMHRSALTPDPVFDVSLRPHIRNRPVIETLAPFGAGGADQFIQPVSSLRRGAITVANLCILRKTGERRPAPPVLHGYDETADWVHRAARASLKTLWADWQTVALVPEGDGRAATALLDMAEGAMEIAVDGLGDQGEGVEIAVIQRRPSPPLEAGRAATLRHGPGAQNPAFLARPGWVYGFQVRRLDGGDPAALRLRLRRRPAARAAG